MTTIVHQTTSLYLTNRRDFSNSIVERSDSNLNISQSNIQRRSLRNIEKFSGIKCSLFTGKSTVPNTFKGLEKHRNTPTKTKQANISSSFAVSLLILLDSIAIYRILKIFLDYQLTSATKNEKVKSPWRLRFEKFLNHQELTPLSQTEESLIVFTTAKVII